MRKSTLYRSTLLWIVLAIGHSAGASAKPLHPYLIRAIVGEQGSIHNAEESSYKISQSKDVVMYLLGTTPLRNWKMSAHGLTGDARMVVTSDNRLLEIHSLSFDLPVYNLRGDVDAMNEDAYTALKARRYRDIAFTLVSASINLERAELSLVQGERTYAIAAKGTLTVAGVTKHVTLKMHSQVGRDGSIICYGEETLRMSDYNIERPTIFFGAIRAGDEMTLSYNLIFAK